MRKATFLIAAALLLAITVAGCGGKVTVEKTTPAGRTTPGGKTGTEADDIEWLKAYINRGSSANPDFDRNSFDRISFAEDDQGNRWALVFTKSYYKSNPGDGLFEAHVFEKADGKWKRVTGGSGGFSEGVPPEVQREWGIEGM